MDPNSSPWYDRWIDEVDSSQEETAEVPLEELSGIEGFTDLEDDVFLRGTNNDDDDWMLPLTVHVDRQQDADDDQEVAAIMEQPRPPLATLALAMPPPASPSSPIDIPRRQRPPRLTIPPRDFYTNYYSPITPSPPQLQLERPMWPTSRPVYSPITPSPPRNASPPMIVSPMLAEPRPIYSPITPPVAVVPPVMSSSLTTLPTPTLTEVLTVLGRMSPTMATILDNGM